MARTFTFKKIKPTVVETTAKVMDKRAGTLETEQHHACVQYEFNKPADCLNDEAMLTLTIQDQCYTQQDLEEFINFLTAARQRLIKLNSKLGQ